MYEWLIWCGEPGKWLGQTAQTVTNGLLSNIVTGYDFDVEIDVFDLFDLIKIVKKGKKLFILFIYISQEVEVAVNLNCMKDEKLWANKL